MRNIKSIIFSILCLVLFVSLVHKMAGHLRHIAIPNDQMDEEINMLREAGNLLPAGTPVAFATNINNADEATSVYYQTQFAYCPHILSTDVSQCDNIIFLRSYSARDSDMSFLHHCDTLYRRQGGAFAIMVLRKQKSN